MSEIDLEEEIPERVVALDTETTGLRYDQGDRVIEIGAVEVIGNKVTGVNFRRLINPGRPIPPASTNVHGITDDDVRNEPKIDKVADELLAFIGDSPLVIHNAAFDVGFLDHEFTRFLNRPPFSEGLRVIDTLLLARKKFPTRSTTLDALCDRFEVDRSRRTQHGALLDSELLAEVFLHLIGRRKRAILFADYVADGLEDESKRVIVRVKGNDLVRQPTPDEEQAHELWLETTMRKKGITPVFDVVTPTLDVVTPTPLAEEA